MVIETKCVIIAKVAYGTADQLPNVQFCLLYFSFRYTIVGYVR